MTVISLGIDLATQAPDTAACVLAWSPSSRHVVSIERGVTDERIRSLHDDATITAIDAPFGWPVVFARQVATYAGGEAWPREQPADLWWRHTDVRAAERSGGARPLSVSADRIARTAERAARLLTLLGDGVPLERAGRRVVEVYPAGSLRCWAIPAEATRGHRPSYKVGPSARGQRERIADQLLAASRLEVSPNDAARMVATDHALDALIAALTGIAVNHNAAWAPAAGAEATLAATEGWIWLPSTRLTEL